MRFAILGSGSKGNATVIESKSTRVLVDCGFNTSEAAARLARLGIEPRSLNAILVTHEHGDHLGGVAPFARRYQIPVWMTHGTHAVWYDPQVPEVRQFSPHESLRIGDLEVQPYPVPHDAREPCQYVFGDGQYRVGILSDAGHATTHMREVLSGLDALMLEFNHDPQMLADGPYTPQLKRRVGGPVGHLSNPQAGELLRQLDCTRLQHLVLTHLSEVNNRPDKARAAAVSALQKDADWLVCAHQQEGLGWREVS